MSLRKYKQYERVRLLFKKSGYDMNKARQQVFKRASGIRQPILDVGTGPGRMAYTLALAGFKVTTVDVSKPVIEVARLYARRYRVLRKIKFLNMDAQNLEFKSNSFNAVFCANLLHDVGNPGRVVDEIIRVCRPKGKIVISDLNENGRALVNKVYRINSQVHRSKIIDLDKVAGRRFTMQQIVFDKYVEEFVTTFVAVKPG